MTDSLQFDKAEYAGAGTGAASACTGCQQALGTQYYELNGQVICSACKVRLVAARERGSRLGRVLRALLFGGVAAALGTAIWYGVRALSGYEFGLLAILVGLAVGAAVRAGSRGRGGWAYQALAMFLTYASIVSTYVPDIVKALRDSHADGAPAPVQATPVSTPPVSTPPAPATAPAPTAPVPPMSLAQGLGTLALASLLLMALAFAAPFLGGLENIMGLVIIAIGLYEAWKINRATPFVVGGPYRIAAAAPPPRG